MEYRAEQAIEELFSLFGNDVYRFALYTLHNEQEAMDVVQETFFRAFKSWDQYRNDGAPKTWLFYIARNYMIDLMRKKRRDEVRQGALIQMSETSHPIESLLELTDMISKLPEKYRQIITLRVIQDLSVTETAQILGCTESSVRMIQHRAVKKLREYLQEPVTEKGGQVRGI